MDTDTGVTRNGEMVMYCIRSLRHVYFGQYDTGPAGTKNEEQLKCR